MEILLTPPDEAEVGMLGRGVVSAVAGPHGLTELQKIVIAAVFHSMTGHDLDVEGVQPIGPPEFADALARRNQIFRARIVQVMLMAAFVVRPLPEDVAAQLAAFADALGVHDDMLDVARRYAEGALDLASADFARNGYLSSIGPERLAAMHSSPLGSSWGQVVDDPASRRAGGRWRICR